MGAPEARILTRSVVVGEGFITASEERGLCYDFHPLLTWVIGEKTVVDIKVIVRAGRAADRVPILTVDDVSARGICQSVVALGKEFLAVQVLDF